MVVRLNIVKNLNKLSFSPELQTKNSNNKTTRAIFRSNMTFDLLSYIPWPSTEILPSFFKKAKRYIGCHKKTSFLISSIALLAIRYEYIIVKRRINKHVPGPVGLPFIGSIVSRILSSIYDNGEYYIKLPKIYGPICSVSLGPMNFIVLNHSSLVKEILVKRQLNDRNNLQYKQTFTIFGTKPYGGDIPMAMINGHKWQTRRRLALSLLTNIPLNMLKEISDESLADGLFPVLNKLSISIANNTTSGDHEEDGIHMKNDVCEEWKPHDDCMWLAFNTIYHYNVGKSMARDDPFRKELNYLIDQSFGLVLRTLWLTKFPFLKHTSYIQHCFNVVNRRTEMIQQLIEKRLEIRKRKQMENNSINISMNDKTYIDAMLEYEKNGEITRDAMLADITILFSAGTETTASTLEGGIMLFAKYPAMQARFRGICLKLWELNGKPVINGEYKQFLLNWLVLNKKKNRNVPSGSVVKSDQEIQFEKGLINQFKAFCFEILRISSIAGQGVAHYLTNKSETIHVKKEYGTLDGKDHTYILPKNSFIVYNSEYIHKYSKYESQWKHNKLSNGCDMYNDEICLENWFEDDNDFTKLKKIGSMPFFPFGMGKRDCLGRRLAQNEFEIFIASLMMNFSFSFDCEKYGNNPANVKIEWKRKVTSSIASPNSVRVSRIR